MSSHRRVLVLQKHICAVATAAVVEPAPFTLAVSEESLSDLQRRLRSARFPDQLEDLSTGWEYGTELGFLKRVACYWADIYDWRAAEAKLNSMCMFTLAVDGITMHFVHKRSPHPNAKPLIFNHGWPGSFFEVHKILDGLTHGDSGRAFHVVAPSLPGYGFSDAPKKRGWDTVAIADIHHKLMLALGYDKYFAQGGDWGALVTRNMGVRYPQHCLAIHVNMPIAPPPKDFKVEDLDKKDQALFAESMQFRETEHAYQHVQKTKPQSLSYGLMDSPVALAAWILEKFRTWSDCGPTGDLESVYSLDELLTNISIYWFSGCIASSCRLYYESLPTMAGTHKQTPQHIGMHCSVPTGVAIFPKECFATKIRSWVERTHNVCHWREFDQGGHFAALEQPGILLEEIRYFFHEAKHR